MEESNILEKMKQILHELRQVKNTKHYISQDKQSLGQKISLIKSGVRHSLDGTKQVVVGSKEIALGIAEIRLALGMEQALPLHYIASFRRFRPQTTKDFMMMTGAIATLAGIGYMAGRWLLKGKRKRVM